MKLPASVLQRDLRVFYNFLKTYFIEFENSLFFEAGSCKA